MRFIIRLIDALSRTLAVAVMGIIVVLVSVMIFEVIMRRFLNAPTLWAFDVSYMLNGCIFIGASSYALLNNGHVRVTFISQNFSEKTRRLIDAAFFLFLFLPAIGFLANAAVSQAVSTFLDGTTERVSPWAPVIWPFYAGLAAGVCGLWLQALSETLKAFVLVASGEEEMPPAVVTAEAQKG